MSRESNKYEVIYCADDDENRVFCENCDKIYRKILKKSFEIRNSNK